MSERHYQVYERGIVRDMFSRLMPDFPLSELHDAELTAVYGRLIINIDKLDKLLEQKYPQDYDTMSMEEIIWKHHGERAVELIRSLL